MPLQTHNFRIRFLFENNMAAERIVAPHCDTSCYISPRNKEVRVLTGEYGYKIRWGVGNEASIPLV